jgi:hypothetical protein
MSSNSKLGAAALVLSSVACALSIYVALTQAAPAPSDDTEALQARIAGLEHRLEELAEAGAPDVPVLAAESASPRTPADLDARLDRLEAGLADKGADQVDRQTETAAVAGPAGAADDDAQLTKSGRPKRGTAQHLQWARQRVLDQSLTPMERSEALGEVQKHGADGFSEDVVQAMVVLGQTAADPEVRENVWRQFDGARNPTLGIALRQALATDAAPGVRREAAEALDRFRDDPVVRAALEQAAQSDADEKVRWEALRSLRKPMKSQPAAPGGGSRG